MPSKKQKQDADDSVMAVIKRTDTENPDPEDLEKLKKVLDDSPAMVRVNDPARRALSQLIDSYSTSAAIRELLRRQMGEKRAAMGYDGSSVIEQMLIDQVLLCQLRLNHLEIWATERLSGQHTLDAGLYYEKRLTFAQRRLTRALETLAKVRKLMAEADVHAARAEAIRVKAAVKVSKLQD